MNKIIITLMAVLGLFGMTATAQSVGQAAPCCKQGTTPGENNKMYQPREFTEFAFEGILLDINQQTRIDSLNAAMKANKPECKKADCKKGEPQKVDCKKAACKKAEGKRGECKKGDCQNPECKKNDCKKGDCKKGDCKVGKQISKAHGHMGKGEYIAKVEEILTPDQFAIFMSNISSMGPKCGKPMLQNGKMCPESKAKQCPAKAKKAEHKK